MACSKYTLSNTGSTIVYVNYRRCDDGMWEYQVPLEQNQTKNVWIISNTFSSAFTGKFELVDDGVFPPVPVTPTPTPSSVTPTPTPTNTGTPTQTPTNTPTTTQTPSSTPIPYSNIEFVVNESFDYFTITNGGADILVDFGDSTQTFTGGNDIPIPHTYGTPGSYTIRVYSNDPITSLGINADVYGNNRQYLLSVNSLSSNIVTCDLSNNDNVTAIDTTGLINCTSFACYGSPLLTSINTTSLTSCLDFDCGGSGLVNFDTAGLTACTTFNCGGCMDLQTLTLTDLSNCASFACDNCNSLTTIDTTPLTSCLDFDCGDSILLSTINLAGLTSCLTFNCGGCSSLTTLDTTGMIGCTSFACDNSGLSTIVLSGLSNCLVFDAGDCLSLTSIDVSPLLNCTGFTCGGCLTLSEIIGTNIIASSCFEFAVDTCNLNTISVNTILIDFDGGGNNNGILYVDNQTPPAPPLGAGITAKDTLISNGWNVAVDGTSSLFISTWSASTPSETIYLPLYNFGTYDFIVDWGDGNIENISSYTSNSHTYADASGYTVSISGIIKWFNFDAAIGSFTNLTEILQWGCLNIGSLDNAFNGCVNLILNSVSDTPNLNELDSSVSDALFANCTSLTSVNNFNTWDMSNITSMNNMFLNDTLFNEDISAWNVSNVISMASMFYSATSFDQPIGNWERTSPTNSTLSGVTNMVGMFQYASSFNQPIGNWNTSSLQSMNGMFSQATLFNQPIGNWDVSGVMFMNGLFYECTSFNQDISNWVVSNVFDMGYMFYSATSFDQSISGWSILNVTNFTGFMSEKTSSDYSTTNYDALLNGWAASTVSPSIDPVDFGTINYTSTGQPGRDILTGGTNSWNIVDGGIV